MCGGTARRQHHRQQEQMRQETLLRDAQEEAARQQERMMQMQMDADRRQQEALRQIAESSKQPFKVRSAAEATTPAMRTKQKPSSSQSSLSSLRIQRTPATNVGLGASGTNVP